MSKKFEVFFSANSPTNWAGVFCRTCDLSLGKTDAGFDMLDLTEVANLLLLIEEHLKIEGYEKHQTRLTVHNRRPKERELRGGEPLKPNHTVEITAFKKKYRLNTILYEQPRAIPIY